MYPPLAGDFYPQLTAPALFTADEQVQLPAVRSPQLVLSVEFTPGSQGFEAATRWRWDYLPANPVGTMMRSLPWTPLGYPGKGEDRADIRDTPMSTGF